MSPIACSSIGDISMCMRKTSGISAFLIAMVFLFFIRETSVAQKVPKTELVPLFSITAVDTGKKLNSPNDVFIDEKHGEIYVVDSGNRRVVVFDMDGFYRYQFVVPGNLGGSPNSLVLNNRDEILMVVGGKVAVCDFRGSFLEYVEFKEFPDAEKVRGTRLKIDKEDNYYLLDAIKQRILVFDSDWNFKFAIGRENMPYVKKAITAPNGKEHKTKPLNVSDICVDEDGKIYLVDSIASYVFVFDGKGKYLRSIGEPGATFNTLSFPNGVAVDNQGRVLVVDTTGNGLLGYSKDGKFLFALGGLGKRAGRFYFPKYVSTDKSGRIYVVEPFLGRIQVLTVKTSS